MASLIVCDLGGVVLRVDASRCHQCWSSFSDLSAAEVADRLYPDAAYEAFERGELAADEYFSYVRQVLGTDVEVARLIECFNSIYVGVDHDVLNLLCGFRDEGVRLVALTNSNETHQRHSSRIHREQLQLFDHVYRSFDLGTRKPEPSCFRRVLEREGVGQPQEAVFIDDLEGHVEAAEALGIQGVHFKGAPQLRQDLAPRFS